MYTRFRGTCCLQHQGPDDGGSTNLWNVGRQLLYTAVHPRRQIWTSCCLCEISSSQGGEYEVQNCLLRCTHVPLKRRSTITLHGSTSQKTNLNFVLPLLGAKLWALQTVTVDFTDWNVTVRWTSVRSLTVMNVERFWLLAPCFAKFLFLTLLKLISIYKWSMGVVDCYLLIVICVLWLVQSGCGEIKSEEDVLSKIFRTETTRTIHRFLSQHFLACVGNATKRLDNETSCCCQHLQDLGELQYLF
jgi:hypothetical protein